MRIRVKVRVRVRFRVRVSVRARVRVRARVGLRVRVRASWRGSYERLRAAAVPLLFFRQARRVAQLLAPARGGREILEDALARLGLPRAALPRDEHRLVDEGSISSRLLLGIVPEGERRLECLQRAPRDSVDMRARRGGGLAVEVRRDLVGVGAGVGAGAAVGVGLGRCLAGGVVLLHRLEELILLRLEQREVDLLRARVRGRVRGKVRVRVRVTVTVRVRG